MTEAVDDIAISSSANDQRRPRMRGWIHLLSAFASIPCGAILIQHAQPGPSTAGATLFAVSLSLLLLTSGTYHTFTWSERPRAILRLLDHSMIFMLLGGSYSPFLLGLQTDWALYALPAVWFLVVLGILRTLFFPNISRWLKSLIYVAMGWMAVPMMKPFYDAYGGTVLMLLLIGGVAYTGGAVIYTKKTPNPWPRMFGYHEIFHVGVVIGCLCHYVAVWNVVA